MKRGNERKHDNEKDSMADVKRVWVDCITTSGKKVHLKQRPNKIQWRKFTELTNLKEASKLSPTIDYLSSKIPLSRKIDDTSYTDYV